MVIMMNVVIFKQVGIYCFKLHHRIQISWVRHFPVFQIKYDFFQCYLFAFCIAHTQTFIGFGLGEFTLLISDSVIAFIVVVKFFACNIAADLIQWSFLSILQLYLSRDSISWLIMLPDMPLQGRDQHQRPFYYINNRINGIFLSIQLTNLSTFFPFHLLYISVFYTLRNNCGDKLLYLLSKLIISPNQRYKFSQTGNKAFLFCETPECFSLKSCNRLCKWPYY